VLLTFRSNSLCSVLLPLLFLSLVLSTELCQLRNSARLYNRRIFNQQQNIMWPLPTVALWCHHTCATDGHAGNMSCDSHLLLMCDITDPTATARHTENTVVLLLQACIVFMDLLPGKVLIKYATVSSLYGVLSYPLTSWSPDMFPSIFVSIHLFLHRNKILHFTTIMQKNSWSSSFTHSYSWALLKKPLVV
jgi:hypothetical protein